MTLKKYKYNSLKSQCKSKVYIHKEKLKNVRTNSNIIQCHFYENSNNTFQ